MKLRVLFNIVVTIIVFLILLVISRYENSDVVSESNDEKVNNSEMAGGRVVLENNYVEGCLTVPTKVQKVANQGKKTAASTVTKGKVKFKKTEESPATSPRRTPSIFNLNSEQLIFAKSLKTKRSNTDYFPARKKTAESSTSVVAVDSKPDSQTVPKINIIPPPPVETSSMFLQKGTFSYLFFALQVLAAFAFTRFGPKKLKTCKFKMKDSLIRKKRRKKSIAFSNAVKR